MKPLAPLVAIFLAITPTAAAEDPEVGAGDHAFLAGIETVSAPEPAGTSSQATSSPVEYIYEPACERGSGAASDSFYGCGSQQSCGTDGLLFSVVAVSSEGSNPLGFTCIEPGQATPVDILTPGRILEAFERIPLPEAPLEVQPPGGVTLVNFDTILHTDAQPFTETVQLLNRQITFDIEPSEFTWTLGDGRTLTTTDPGRAWRAGPHAGACPTARGDPSPAPSTSPLPRRTSRSPPRGRSSSPTTEPRHPRGVLHRFPQIRLHLWRLSAARGKIRT